MLLCQKRDAKAQTTYWRGVYSKMCAVLESRIKHNTLESAFVELKSRKQGHTCTLLLATFCLFRSFCSIPFCSVPFRVLLIPQIVTPRPVTKVSIACMRGNGIYPASHKSSRPYSGSLNNTVCFYLLGGCHCHGRFMNCEMVHVK